LALEPGRTEQERERSLVLREASNRVAAAQDTDEDWAWLLTRRHDCSDRLAPR